MLNRSLAIHSLCLLRATEDVTVTGMACRVCLLIETLCTEPNFHLDD